MTAEALKAAAAARALELVEPGMLIGLGTGSTARYFTVGLAERVADGLRVVGVPSSEETRELAESLGIPLTLDLERPIDLAVDGADEIDGSFNLLKGAGGALAREKLVALVARRLVVVADESKLVDRLGRGPLAVEILPFLWRQTALRLGELCDSWALRGGEEAPFRTDNGNLVVDLGFVQGISEPALIGEQVRAVAGVVEHGLFIGLARGCILGTVAGVRVLGRLDI